MESQALERKKLVAAVISEYIYTELRYKDDGYDTLYTDHVGTYAVKHLGVGNCIAALAKEEEDFKDWVKQMIDECDNFRSDRLKFNKTITEYRPSAQSLEIEIKNSRRKQEVNAENKQSYSDYHKKQHKKNKGMFTKSLEDAKQTGKRYCKHNNTGKK